jgi:hypothetical protein
VSDFEKYNQAISDVIEYYRENGYDEIELTGLRRMLLAHIDKNMKWDDAADFLLKYFETQGVKWEKGDVAVLATAAIFKLGEFYEDDE